MGSDKLTEAPVHRRSVAGFWIDPHEVTYGEFRRILPDLVPADLAKSKPDDDMPMTLVDFNVAVAYAERVGKRLPEERAHGQRRTGTPSHAGKAGRRNRKTSSSGEFITI